ncbi:MAG: Aerobic carbon monoxide dehydrogenase (quinone), large chain, partial [uncultured Solirubrobacteraceae bacterium]
VDRGTAPHHRLWPDEAQGGPALRPRSGPLRRRSQAPRDAARRRAAQPGRPRAHRLDRHDRRRRAPQGQGGHHRRRPRGPRPGLDADDVGRHAGSARHGQGALPGPGGRVRRRRGPLQRSRRAGAHRGRVRGAARRRQRAHGAGCRRAGHPRRPGGAQRQPHLRLGGGRRGGGRPRLRRRRRDRRARHDLPALPPGSAGDLRRGRADGPGHGAAHVVDDHAGTPRTPHGVRARRRAARAQDPDHRRGHRRRLRQQGAGLPRLRLRDRGLDPHRQAGQVGGGPRGEPDVDGLRARLRHARADLCQGRQDHRPAGARHRRPRRVQRDGAADEVSGRLLPHLLRLLRPGSRALPRHRRLHEQGAGRRGLPLLVQGDRGRLPRRADGRRARARAEDGSRGAAPEELHPARAVPLPEQDGLGLRLRRLREGDAPGDGDRGLRRAARRAGRETRPWGAHGDRHLVLHRDRRGRPAQGHGHPRPGDERRRRPARAPDGQGGARHQRHEPGAGTRDDLRPDRLRGAGTPVGGHRGGQRRHRPHPLRPGHLRQPGDPGLRRGDRARRAQGARARAPDRGGHARGRARRPRVGAGPLVRQGRPRAVQDDPGDRHGRPRRGRPARGRGGDARGHLRLQPAQPDVPVRRLHLRRRHRPGDREGAGPPVHRGRRLRRADQPHDRRRPDPRRPRGGHRHRADGAHRLRRAGQLPRRVVHGLPHPDVDRGARVGARGDGHPLTAPSDRREGRRRVADRRVAAGDRQRDHRRAARDPRRRPHRHAVHAVTGVGGDAGQRDAPAM